MAFCCPFFGAATKQNNQRFTTFSEVDAIARPPFNLVLTNTLEPFDALGIPQALAMFYIAPRDPKPEEHEFDYR